MNHMISAFDNWYGFLIGMAMLLCIFLAYILLKKRGYHPDIVFNIAIICLPCAIVGARFYYIIFDPDHSFSYWFTHNGSFTLMKLIGFENIGNGWKFEGLSGLAIYGGLILAAVGAIFVRLWNKRDKNPTHQMTFMQMLDAFFVLIILGQVIGRWGNFANGEAYGKYISNPKWQWFPLAVYIKDPKNAGEMPGYYQATFFYEAFLNLIGFFVLLYLCYGKKKSFDGFVFSAYCIWYGLVRMFVEGLRGDSLYWGPFRVSQLLSGVLILSGAAIIVWHIVTAKRTAKRVFIFVPQSQLSTEYCGYDKTIMYINSIYNRDGWLKSEIDANPEINGSKADIKKRFSYSHADDAGKSNENKGTATEENDNNYIDSE